MAPVMPFLSEAMYQNLKGSGARGQGSVHHEAFPSASDELIDGKLSSDMDALLQVVSLGFSLRNIGKVKVRQPLAELRVQPATDSLGDAIQRAVERFPEQIMEELNIKKVSLHDAAKTALLEIDVKPNLKTLGPKLGSRLKDATAALARLSPASMAKTVGAGQPLELTLDGEVVKLDPVDLLVQTKAPGGWVGLADRGTQLALDIRITDELASEGLAREVIRHVQQARKDAGLQMEDRIVLHLQTDAADLQKAIDTHRDYIASETLVARWSAEPLGDEAYKATVKVEGKPLTIQLAKAAS
jgi:isoleucyl-tRNA synthetase